MKGTQISDVDFYGVMVGGPIFVSVMMYILYYSIFITPPTAVHNYGLNTTVITNATELECTRLFLESNITSSVTIDGPGTLYFQEDENRYLSLTPLHDDVVMTAKHSILLLSAKRLTMSGNHSIFCGRVTESVNIFCSHCSVYLVR